MQALGVKKIALIIFYTFTALLAFISLKSLIGSLIPTDGLMGAADQYIGRDFLFFYAAARHAVIGNISELYNNGLIANTGGTVIPELGNGVIPAWAWLYPPHYLLLLAPLGFLPYYFALALWLSVSLLLPAYVLWHFWKMRGGLWLAAIFNVNVLYCLNMGQNALIFAAIAGMGIALLQKRPVLAGVCFAILSMKPHFAILIPIALILGHYWKVLFYTIAITLLLVVATSLAFGWDVWDMAITHFSMVQNISISRKIWFFSIYSAYRAFLEIGLSNIYAWFGYFIIAVIALYGFGKVWLGQHDLATKWLALGIAALLCSPYNLAYDAVWVVLPVMAWLAQKNYNLPLFTYILFAMLIFAIAIVSVSPNVSIILIISALIILLWFANSRPISSS